MKTKRPTKPTILRDIRGVINRADVLYHVGNVMYKRSLRYTAFTAGICLLGYFAGSVGFKGFTAKQALALPLAVGAITLLGGAALKLIPSLISSRLLTVAQASDLNLMEDYRKSQVRRHLDALWERVFKYEWRSAPPTGRMPPSEAPRLARALSAAPDLADPDRRGRKEFLILAEYALNSHLPQTREAHQLGIDLSFFEDWRDGAYLDRSDTKLIEQFEGNATINAIKKETGLGRLSSIRKITKRLVQRAWFFLIARAVAIGVGRAVENLNKKYRTDVFNSQVLLWPGEENEKWLDRFPGARRDVIERRKAVIRRVFGRDYQHAEIMLDRMFFCCFEFSTELRALFDPDYLDGSLEYGLLADLRAARCRPGDIDSLRGLAESARRELSSFMEFLRQHRARLFDNGGGRALQAARIAFHTDAGGLKRIFLKHRKGGSGRDDDVGAVNALTDSAVERKDRYARMLVALRLHHELTRLAREDYGRLLKALAYSD